VDCIEQANGSRSEHNAELFVGEYRSTRFIGGDFPIAFVCQQGAANLPRQARRGEA
jgi:hypothetical protein